ncbi:hypothetical protein GBAR_LOCUS16819 [Geodia barretti]|uniref:Uncharacterized protein n=1 Tax=Geodia barretti TaxID=519541 RepID=A0AA35WR24_GEOBA|nr:hypothetical protein GBAR_LOCUS16819 [Geodia barretti]
MNYPVESQTPPTAPTCGGLRGHAPSHSPPPSSHLEPASSSLQYSPPTRESIPALTMAARSMSSSMSSWPLPLSTKPQVSVCQDMILWLCTVKLLATQNH